MSNELALFQVEELIAPPEIIGEKRKSGGYTKTTPREWTPAEVNWLLEKKNAGYSNKELALALDRSDVSIQIKLKRLTKTNDSYNEKHREEKYAANTEFFNRIEPRSVLDVFAGNSFWQELCPDTVTNDKDERFWTDYNLDSLDFLCEMKLKGKKFDLIDLDPYGSAYDCFDLAIKLAKKAVVVSFGEYGHKRWKRFDYVLPRYDIRELEDFDNVEKFIGEFQRVAACNKKIAKPRIVLQYGNFVRVYFELSDLKVTSQWDKAEAIDGLASEDR
jgi:hypothetical protein